MAGIGALPARKPLAAAESGQSFAANRQQSMALGLLLA
jgi:hypothetical protein